MSIDEDVKRLRRYLDDAKFPFPVARVSPEYAQRVMAIDNTPTTLYVGADGIVRYRIGGTEPHGDSPARVAWFLDELIKSY